MHINTQGPTLFAAFILSLALLNLVLSGPSLSEENHLDQAPYLADHNPPDSHVDLLAERSDYDPPETYVSIRSGISVWNDTSNGDGVEADGKDGFAVFAAAGRDHEWFRYEVEARYSRNALHGRNDGPAYRRSVDGGYLHAGAVMANIWPHLEVLPDFRMYAGGGVGGVVVSALEDTRVLPAGQAGAGFLWDVAEDWTLELGGRYFVTPETSIRDDGRSLDLSFESISGFLGVSWRFGQ